MRLLNRDGLLAPDRSLKPLMKQRQSRRNRGRGDRALRKPRHNLSPFRRQPPMLDLTRIRFLRGKVTGAICVASRPAVADQSGPQIPGVGRVDNTSRRWVPFSGLTPPIVRKDEIGRGRSRGGPTEPPIGYGWTYRSICPESHSERTAAPCFRGDGSGKNNSD
jgi:hypothetical protein